MGEYLLFWLAKGAATVLVFIGGFLLIGLIETRRRK